MPIRIPRLLVFVAMKVVASNFVWPVHAGETFEAESDRFSADDLMPLTLRRASFRMREDEREVEVAWSRRPAPERDDSSRSDGLWEVSISGRHSTLLEKRNDGGIYVVEHWDRSEGNRVQYDPPAVFLPPRLAPGEEYTSESEVTIFKGQTEQIKARGRCEHRVSLVGRERLDLPAGHFDVVRVDLVRSMDVSIGGANATIELSLVQGRGRVKERTVEQIEVLGIAGGREISLLELVQERATKEPLRD